MRYNLATLAELRVFKPLPYTLELDGERRRLDAMLVAVGNGPSYGGGLRMCEGALLDDGHARRGDHQADQQGRSCSRSIHGSSRAPT